LKKITIKTIVYKEFERKNTLLQFIFINKMIDRANSFCIANHNLN